MRFAASRALALVACGVSTAVLVASTSCKSDSFASSPGGDAAVEGSSDAAAAEAASADAAAEIDATHLCDRTTHDWCADFDNGFVDPAVADYDRDGGQMSIDTTLGSASPFSLIARTTRGASYAELYKSFPGLHTSLALSFDIRIDEGGTTASMDIAAWKIYDAAANRYMVMLRVVGGMLEIHDVLDGLDAGLRTPLAVQIRSLALPSTRWLHVDFDVTFTPGSPTASWTVVLDGVQPPKGSGTAVAAIVPSAGGNVAVSAGLVYARDVPQSVHLDNVTVDAR